MANPKTQKDTRTFRVTRLSLERVLPLRAKVLRPGRAPSDCINPEDHDPLTFHFGALVGDRVIAIASFQAEDPKGFTPTRHTLAPYRLRGMASDPESRISGAARATLLAGLRELQTVRRSELLWFNARRNALGFYEKLGFEIVSDEFEIPGIGPHRIMMREL